MASTNGFIGISLYARQPFKRQRAKVKRALLV